MKTNSLERIVPDALSEHETTGTDTFRLHMERYEFAHSHVYGVVMDAACGVGYGSFHLANPAKINKIIAVDIDEKAIEYAAERYPHPKIEFVCNDIMLFQPTSAPDCIVSLETIEHVHNPQALIKHFFNVLKPDGILVASVPVTPSVDANPHHMSDFTAKSFEKLLSEAGFCICDRLTQIQTFSPFKIAAGREKRAENIRKNLMLYYVKHPESLLKRIWSTLCYGFTNRYLTVMSRKKR